MLSGQHPHPCPRTGQKETAEKRRLPPMTGRKNISGHRIRAARALHVPKLTQDDLIALMHTKENIVLSKNILSRMETGDRYITDLELMAFSRVLGIPIAWFLRETDDPRGLPAGRRD